MADDIVTRLRHAEDNGICEWQVLVLRDLIGKHGFTQEHYDLLTGPWRSVIGPVHPDDAEVGGMSGDKRPAVDDDIDGSRYYVVQISKYDAMKAEIGRLRDELAAWQATVRAHNALAAERADEIERLRAAGERLNVALLVTSNVWGRPHQSDDDAKFHHMVNVAVDCWGEARRG